jgi:hypothetical protein
MHAREREELKEQLRTMAAGRGDGIDLDSPDRWTIEGVRDPVAFFRYLSLLIPADSILYFEGSDIPPAVAGFYEANRARDGVVCVARETVYPVPEVFHVQMGPGVIEGLTELLAAHSRQDCFCHVKVYREEKVLVHFHDAFDGSPLLLSDRIALERVQSFCASLGAVYRRERNGGKRDPEALLLLLRALENPEKVRILWPWWKRALLFWKR